MAAKTTDPIDILLEMGIDLDNLSEEEDYLSALKEAIAKIQFQTKGAGDERSAILSQEVIKVRKSRKAADPKFKAKKTTVSPDAFFERKPDEVRQDVKTGAIDPSKLKFDSVEIASKQKALPTSAITPYQAPEEEEGAKKKRAPRKSDPLKDILKGVNSIIEILKRQQKLSTKQAEKDRKRAERQKRKGSEDKLESGGIKNFISGASKLIKPVKGLLDGIFDFIKNVIIGAILIKIIKWFTDKDNEKKIKAIGEFFKNTWPALLAAYLLFGNSFTSFIAKMLLKVGIFTAKLIGTVIPALIGAIKRFGLGKSAKLLSVVGGTALLANRLMDGGKDDVDLTKGEDDKDSAPTSDKPAADGEDKPETKQTVAGQEYDPANPTDLQKKTTDMATQMGNPPPAKMKGGGIVPGSGPNRDTVPAMLAPGEFVMSRGAVQKYGTSTMASMNAAGGGTNLPKRMNGVTYAAGGGLMGDMSNYGYGEDKKEEPSPKVENEMEERAKAKGDGGLLSGITGGIQSLFGGGNKNEESIEKENKDEEKKGDTETKGGISKNAKALLNTIRWAEGTLKPDGYNTWFGGRSDMDLTSMTINEVVAEQKRRLSAGEATYGQYTSAAVGAYQMMKPEAFAAAAGLSGDSKFTPENQDKMAIAGYMMGQAGMSAAEIDAPISRAQIAKMAPVWASLPMMNGASRYGQPVKSYDDLVAVYDKNLKGLDPSSFTATTGIAGAKGVTPASSPGAPGAPGSTPKKPHKFGSGIAALTGSNPFTSSGGSAPPGPPVSAFQALQNPAAMGSSSASQGSGNSSATQVPNQNQFPSIDANAMISREKIKVLGLTVA
jgi:muramidase (phage lysozyme)